MSLDKSSNPKIGMNLSQEELEEISREDWSIYMFWREVRPLTLENLTMKHGETSFGSGEEIIELFDETVVSERYSDRNEYLKDLQEEHGFENTATAAMYETLDPYNQNIDPILRELENNEPIGPSEVRKILDAARTASEASLEEYTA